MSWTTDELVLGYPVDVHSMGEMAGDKQAVEDLRAVLRELGPALKNPKVTVKLLSEAESGQSGTRSVLEASRESKAAERTKREAEARAHPITKHVLTTFGAQIKEIKTDV